MATFFMTLRGQNVIGEPRRGANILKSLFAGIALGALLFDAGLAADKPIAMPLKEQRAGTYFDWSGLYIGAHMGYGWGRSNATRFDPLPSALSHSYNGINGGVQAGYNVVLPSRVLLGVEADITFPNYINSNAVVSSPRSAEAGLTEKMDYVGSVRARLGYAEPSWMIYATGGFAWEGTRFASDLSGGLEEKSIQRRTGWAAGAGFEYAIDPLWSARLEYLYYDFGPADVRLPSGARYASALDFQTLRIGLNRKIDWPGSTGSQPVAARTAPSSDIWEIHGQTTYLSQGYPGFHAPYTGTNSLTPSRQSQATWSNSLYLNARLWDGGEVYFNPELLQGFGLSNTVGVAGFTSGEAQKSNFPYPRFNPSRFYLRQTFGFGGKQEELPSGPGQLAGKADVSRLTVQAGKFAVPDVFDGNAYAKDPRKDFMNWSIWAPGAFDYSADKVGLTYGVTAELNQRYWALRAGYFLMVSESNSGNFDMKVFQRGNYILELETRYSLFSQPGKFRTIAWLNSAYSGGYRDTLNDPALNLDISQTRRGRIKYGYVFNVEQAITSDIGVFGRWSWNDGKTEIMVFTDIDASLSFGTSIKGTSWGRPDDVIGIGGAFNALSKDHRDFVAAGGLGVLIGDGQINYRQEKILEIYYALAVNKQITATADYQFIANPAYNADRGPVSVFSGRLRGEF
ncbi:carbohydrate porin [Afipia sp. DC4300-2b1]|uniref:carbohydrate porin n=1 Tax=Afipia sp. DC4300-2b1 TaxID=2804672 RepID=UPI003CF72B43